MYNIALIEQHSIRGVNFGAKWQKNGKCLLDMKLKIENNSTIESPTAGEIGEMEGSIFALPGL